MGECRQTLVHTEGFYAFITSLLHYSTAPELLARKADDYGFIGKDLCIVFLDISVNNMCELSEIINNIFLCSRIFTAYQIYFMEIFTPIFIYKCSSHSSN